MNLFDVYNWQVTWFIVFDGNRLELEQAVQK